MDRLDRLDRLDCLDRLPPDVIDQEIVSRITSHDDMVALRCVSRATAVSLPSLRDAIRVERVFLSTRSSKEEACTTITAALRRREISSRHIVVHWVPPLTYLLLTALTTAAPVEAIEKSAATSGTEIPLLQSLTFDMTHRVSTFRDMVNCIDALEDSFASDTHTLRFSLPWAACHGPEFDTMQTAIISNIPKYVQKRKCRPPWWKRMCGAERLFKCIVGRGIIPTATFALYAAYFRRRQFLFTDYVMVACMRYVIVPIVAVSTSPSNLDAVVFNSREVTRDDHTLKQLCVFPRFLHNVVPEVLSWNARLFSIREKSVQIYKHIKRMKYGLIAIACSTHLLLIGEIIGLVYMCRRESGRKERMSAGAIFTTMVAVDCLFGAIDVACIRRQKRPNIIELSLEGKRSDDDGAR